MTRLGPIRLTSKPAALVAATLVVTALLVMLRSGDRTTASEPQPAPVTTPAPPLLPSRAVGLPFAGRLVRGLQLPAEGTDFFTWDPVLKRFPNRGWRRWGTDRLLHTIATVLTEYRTLHPGAPRVGIADLSRPHGGNFGPRYGGRGHASHQNGLDVDVCYPRRDGLERAPRSPAVIDLGLAQDLLNLFVDAGAQYVFVGPHVRLHGPRRIVQPLAFHDDHMHVRISHP